MVEHRSIEKNQCLIKMNVRVICVTFANNASKYRANVSREAI